MKDAYYFPHDSNARNDEKILFLMSRHGVQGYGLYWLFIEQMHEQADGKLTCSLLDGYAFQWHVDKTMLLDCYKDAITIGLFITDGEVFWSERVLRNKEYREEIRQAKSLGGKKGMAKRWGLNNLVITPDKIDITKDNKGKESKGKEIKETTTTSQNSVIESDDSTTSSRSVPAQEIFDAWNKVWEKTPIPAMRELTKTRRVWIKREFNKQREDLKTAEDFRNFFLFLRDGCPFIRDSVASGKTWFSFDWLFKYENNFVKAYEGNYQNRGKTK
jgi:hypothetical protein